MQAHSCQSVGPFDRFYTGRHSCCNDPRQPASIICWDTLSMQRRLARELESVVLWNGECREHLDLRRGYRTMWPGYSSSQSRKEIIVSMSRHSVRAVKTGVKAVVAFTLPATEHMVSMCPCLNGP
jgi:hypothetical protein